MEDFADIKTVYVYAMEATRTGNTRRVRLFAVHSGEIIELTAPIARATKLRFDSERWCIVIQGHGFGLGSHLKPYLADALGHAVDVRTL